MVGLVDGIKLGEDVGENDGNIDGIRVGGVVGTSVGTGVPSSIVKHEKGDHFFLFALFFPRTRKQYLTPSFRSSETYS